jgi:hypothetical protein
METVQNHFEDRDTRFNDRVERTEPEAQASKILDFLVQMVGLLKSGGVVDLDLENVHEPELSGVVPFGFSLGAAFKSLRVFIYDQDVRKIVLDAFARPRMQSIFKDVGFEKLIIEGEFETEVPFMGSYELYDVAPPKEVVLRQAYNPLMKDNQETAETVRSVLLGEDKDRTVSVAVDTPRVKALLEGEGYNRKLTGGSGWKRTYSRNDFTERLRRAVALRSLGEL